MLIVSIDRTLDGVLGFIGRRPSIGAPRILRRRRDLGEDHDAPPRLVPVVAFDLTPPFSALRTSASANSVRRVVRPLCCRDLADERSSGLHDNRRGANRANATKNADNYFSVAIL